MNISHIVTLTYPMIFLAVFANQLCLPIPAVLFLITAGALAKSGNLNLHGAILVSVVGCVLADYAWFVAGRRWGYRVVRGLSSLSMCGRDCGVRARRVFERHGLPTLVFAKFVPGLDGLMPPLAGILNVACVRFLFLDALGSFLWSAAYCLMGYLFAGRLGVVAVILDRTRGVLGVAVVGVLSYLLWRAWELLRTMRDLRLRGVSPAVLHENLKAGKKVAVLDLLDLEGQEDANEIPGIPGAARISPKPLHSSVKVRVPPDVQTVLYCSLPNQIRSARTALLLRRKGISNVWVLEGGLKAWRELDLPVTTELNTPAEVAARFGVELPDETA